MAAEAEEWEACVVVVVAVACVDGRNAGVPFDSDGVVVLGY